LQKRFAHEFCAHEHSELVNEFRFFSLFYSKLYLSIISPRMWHLKIHQHIHKRNHS